MGYVLLAAAALVLMLFAVILIRTAAFRPGREPPAAAEEEPVDETAAIEHLRRMICCKTVSSRDLSLQDNAEFDRFLTLLSKLYPEITRVCGAERIGERGLLYCWKGENPGEPTVLMSHYDVVPANEEEWEKPAFEGILEDGVLWGRGTLDTKTTLLGVMEAAESLIREGFRPRNDIYFSFSGNEEIAGDGAPGIVDELQRHGIAPALVVDEGGAVVNGVFPGVREECALVGIAEKGMMDVELSAKSSGGHASAPPPHGPVGILAKAVADAENRPFRFRLTKPAAELFDTVGRRSTFFYRMIFANLWCFKPLLDAVCKKSGGEMNALLRTTCAFTQMEGSSAPNVLPPRAKIVANLRLLHGDTAESAIRHLKDAIHNDRIEITEIHHSEASGCSVTDSAGYQKLKTAIRQTWPGAVVSPYLMIAASDSRHYHRISDNVLRFSAMALSKEERGLIHGNNERIPVRTVVQTVAFYRRLIKLC